MLVPCRKVRNFCFLQLSYPFRKFWVFVGSFLNIIMWEYLTTENNNQWGCCLYQAVWRPKSGWGTREGIPPDTWCFVKHFSRSLPGVLKWVCLRGSWAQFALDFPLPHWGMIWTESPRVQGTVSTPNITETSHHSAFLLLPRHWDFYSRKLHSIGFAEEQVSSARLTVKLILPVLVEKSTGWMFPKVSLFFQPYEIHSFIHILPEDP